ncbi:hypothetical protein A3B45_04205 [Candidatus Daviesbacteria bacterium RIFCSPLOWO2_01_FULL_39_12]|uniref:Thioredoxin domain-containing protein n=1 Tax=Candidatus Daviesbacteria bacterium RIFCSPLOWO2_01_FULL_39_12 TaxID=1797785 RepID=A0A1F5KT73_9BACT|nr:MAG: hypothetical protein A3B45_04205 [Candidatus Daviesbacteria bacterium RIFCSPLOWO2_01_FULL_39_12]
MERKFIFGIILVCLVLLGVAVFFLSPNSSQNPTPTTFKEPLKILADDWLKGNKEAKVSLVEYSDFQCPACGAYYPLLKQLNQEFGDKILFVYRHFPLPNHKNAEPAAQAAEAAGRQGKFWEMHDLLFENQTDWSNQSAAKETFIEYAQSLNLDIEKFKSDLDSPQVKDKVKRDYQSGLQFKVNATPTFFLNNQKLPNPRSFEEFKSIIQNEIEKTNK